jgi:hypothetical protein
MVFEKKCKNVSFQENWRFVLFVPEEIKQNGKSFNVILLLRKIIGAEEIFI